MRSVIAAALFVLALAGCTAPPEIATASAPGGQTAAFDPRLIGAWYGLDERGGVVLHVLKGEAGSLRVLGIVEEEGDATAPVQWLRATVRPVGLAGRTVYEVRRDGGGFDYTAPGETPGVILAAAEIDDAGALTLRFLSHERMVREAADGRVRGRKVTGGKGGSAVDYLLLDLTPGEAAALLQRTPGEAVFTMTYGPLHRLSVTLPSPRLQDPER